MKRTRLTAEQQLALQKKEKRGVKARKDLLNDEERTRSELLLQEQHDFDELTALHEQELQKTKSRLVERLTSTLEELRTTSAQAIAQAEANYRHMTRGVTSFLSAMANVGVVTDDQLQRMRTPGVSGEALGKIVADLGDSVAERVAANIRKCETAEHKRAVMAQQLTSTQEQLAAVERIVGSKYMTAGSESTVAAEMLRRKGADFEQRMIAVEAEQRAAFQEVIASTRELQYDALCGRHGATASARLEGTPTELVCERYLSRSEHARVKQAEVLRDLQREIEGLTAQHLLLLGDNMRANRTNLPAHAKALLDDPSAVSRADLLRLIDYVSFEPHVTETIIAALQLRGEAERYEGIIEPRAAHDVPADRVLTTLRPKPLVVVPPRSSQRNGFSRMTLIAAADRSQPGFGGGTAD